MVLAVCQFGDSERVVSSTRDMSKGDMWTYQTDLGAWHEDRFKDGLMGTFTTLL